jgi:hypothetical protein
MVVGRRYRQQHTAQVREYNWQWCARNPEKVREYHHRYKARYPERVRETYRKANARRRTRNPTGD